MARLYNLAKVATATTGTGTVTLGSAASGYLTFADAGVQNGDVVTYVIEEGSNREIGWGTYTASGTTLSRDTVLSSTNGGSKITLAGAATVFIDAAAQDIPSTAPDVQTFNSSGTWTKPTNSAYRMALIECWGGGGSGARRNSSGNVGGGGGGAYVSLTIPIASLGSTETVTIGAGGAAVTSGDNNGNGGGNTTFGAWLTAYGGAGGRHAANSALANGGGGGGMGAAPSGASAGQGGGDGGTGPGPDAMSNGGGGGGSRVLATNVVGAAGNAFQGGAGGGGASSSTTSLAGGTSAFGGNGGASASTGAATDGSQPGGGGGGGRTVNSGAGGAGRVIVTCW